MKSSRKHTLTPIISLSIVGYTGLKAKNKQKALYFRKRQQEIIYSLVNTYRGKVLKEIDSRMFILFDSSVRAVRCAVDIKKQLKEEDFSLRIGVYIGDVVIEQGKVAGSGITIASQIQSTAPPGGISISDTVWQQVQKHDDLKARPLGTKKLKGTSMPIDIFELSYYEPLNSEQREEFMPIIKELLKRRVPQVLGLYLAASWAIIQFIDWLVERYMLSPYLPVFGLVILLSMIPTVVILSYMHGRLGRDKWTKTEKIGIPMNLAATGIILFVFFYGKDLGATTATVTLTDEEGHTIERVIPKSEYRKKVALFTFKNESGDSTLDWLQYGLSLMLRIDLSQDLFLYPLDIYDFYDEIKAAGYTEGVELPFAFRKKIATNSHLQYFTTGSFTTHNDSFFIKVSLYSTKQGKSIAGYSFSGTDIFGLVDTMSVQLKYALKIPERHIEEVNDLPISAILTNSIPALEMYIIGLDTAQVHNDWVTSIHYLERAVTIDSTFAAAHYDLFQHLAFLGESARLAEILEAAMRYLYKLPESDQFKIKWIYYQFKELTGEKPFALAKMWVELYPEDIRGHELLGHNYFQRHRHDEAITEYKKILQLDPEQYDYLREIGQIFELKGEFKEALHYYRQYLDKCPDDYRPYAAIGGLHVISGDYDEAKTYYEKAILLEPRESSIILGLACIEERLGNFERVLDLYEDVLKISTVPETRMEIYDSLASFFRGRGQIIKSLEYTHLALAEAKKFQAPMFVYVLQFKDLDSYVMAGREDEAFKIIRTVESKLQPPLDKIIHLGYLIVYLELEDADNAEKAFKAIKELMKMPIFFTPPGFVDHIQGLIHEMRGEYEQAIQEYESMVRAEPTAVAFANIRIGRCYRKSKEFNRAERYLRKALKIFPYDPEAHYEIALVHEGMGNQEKAIEHLKTALDVWQDADPEFKPAREAREKLAELIPES